MTDGNWDPGDTVAWTKRDGYPTPPAGARPWLLGGIAVVMIGVWIGMISTDTLCPEHRFWVQVMATVALVGSVAAVYGLLTRCWWALPITMGVAVIGVAIGLLDAVHDPTRGALIAIAFALVGLLIAVSAVPSIRSVLFASRAQREMTVGPEHVAEIRSGADAGDDVPADQPPTRSGPDPVVPAADPAPEAHPAAQE